MEINIGSILSAESEASWFGNNGIRLPLGVGNVLTEQFELEIEVQRCVVEIIVVEAVLFA